MAETKYTIEVSGGNNQNLLFRPCGRRVRGAWSNGRAAKYDQGRELRSLAHEVGDIPGERIFVDLGKKACGIYDPLVVNEDGKKIAQKLKSFHSKHPIGGQREIRFPEPTLHEKCSASTLKDWLYWMRLAFDAGVAIVPTGCPPLPTLEEIQKLPGKRELHGMGLTDQESKDAVEPMLFAVPDETPRKN